MIRGTRLLGTALLIALAAPAAAGEPPRPAKKVIAQPELTALSGVQQQIRHLSRAVMTGFDKESKQVPPTKQAVVRRVITQSFDANQIERRVSARVAKELPKEHSLKVREWLSSEVGKAIAKLEDRIPGQQAAQQIEATAANTVKTASPARLQLVKRLDLAMGTSETLVESSELAAFGAAMALDSSRPIGERIGEDRIHVQIDQDRHKTRERAQALTFATYLATYQPLSDTDLEHYADFLESDAGREYHRLTGTALQEALYEAGESISRELTAMSGNRKG